MRGRGKQGNTVLHTRFPSALYVAPFVLAQERSQPISTAPFVSHVHHGLASEAALHGFAPIGS